METLAFLVLGLAVVAVVAFIGVNEGRARAARREHDAAPTDEPEEVRTLVERRLVELLEEFPALTDEDVTQLMLDELVNKRVKEREFFKWATVATTARLRRTIVVETLRASRR